MRKVILALNIFQLIMGCLVKHAQTQHKSVTFRPIVNKVRLLQCFLYTVMSDCISFEYNYITPIDIIFLKKHKVGACIKILKKIVGQSMN